MKERRKSAPFLRIRHTSIRSAPHLHSPYGRNKQSRAALHREQERRAERPFCARTRDRKNHPDSRRAIVRRTWFVPFVCSIRGGKSCNSTRHFTAGRKGASRARSAPVHGIGKIARIQGGRPRGVLSTSREPGLERKSNTIKEEKNPANGVLSEMDIILNLLFRSG